MRPQIIRYILGLLPGFCSLQMLWAFTCPPMAHAGGTIKIDDVRSVNVGMGLRTSFNTVEDAAPNRSSWSKDFNLDSFRFYLSGQLLEAVTFEFNTDYDGVGAGDIQVLDAVLKFQFNDYFNIWAGRFLPPSDRSNLSGPYFINSWEFPFVQKYPAIFAGRDNGAALWGQIGGGQFKYQFGAFEGQGDSASGSNQRDELLYAGRLTLNLWDPEPGYYNSSTYYGAMNVLAVGLAGMFQDDSIGTASAPGHFGGWNVDLLLERNLAGLGVATVEGAYYVYDNEGVTAEGRGYFVLGSYLFPSKVGAGKFLGQLQPLVRFQGFKTEGPSVGHQDQLDIGLNYILNAHNARITLNYSIDDPASGPDIDSFLIGLQFQI